MQFAISMPQRFADGVFDPRAFRSFLGRAEALGFESAWAQEQVLGRFPQLGPTETMTFAAACTEHIRLGCAVYVSPLHNPVHLAKSLSTLDQLCGGRLEVGVGAGGKHRPFAAFGIDPESYIARFTEGVALMKACWSEPTITFDGRFWQLHGVAMEPKPVQKPFPRLWFGGGHANALRRAARLVSQNLAQIYAHISADFSKVAVFGSPRTCIEGVREVIDAGAELVLFTPLHDEAAQMERLTAEVVAAF